MNSVLIQADGLKKSFHTAKGGIVPAVRGLDLVVHAGEIYGLVGSDGAGKTTTIRLLAGVLKLDAGKISIGGFDLQKQTEQARAQIGYLPQRFSLYEDLTVLENIRFFAEVRGLRRSEWKPQCMQILDFVGLSEFKDRRAGQLSGGMKQKLGLAAALVARPRILLLDEPTTGVDAVARQDFWQLIIQLISSGSADGICALITTPYMDEASRCHRIGFMRQGKLISEGSPGLLRSTLDGRILELRGTPLPLLRQIAVEDPDIEDARLFGGLLRLRLKKPQPQSVIERLRASILQGGGRIDEARPVPPILEDVFIELASREG